MTLASLVLLQLLVRVATAMSRGSAHLTRFLLEPAQVAVLDARAVQTFRSARAE